MLFNCQCGKEKYKRISHNLEREKDNKGQRTDQKKINKTGTEQKKDVGK